ncbi:MAG: hypothetical protein PHO89_11475 [Methylacidiphilaceae bacterium]|nr:hypothetical protein [Candidatus Methylacidiphilaceae bacterium]
MSDNFFRYIADRNRALLAVCALCALLVAVIVWQTWRYSSILHQPQFALIVGPKGEILYNPLQSPQAEDIRVAMARLAVQAVLDRSQDGPDNPELRKVVLSKRFAEKIRDWQDPETKTYQEQHLHTWFESGPAKVSLTPNANGAAEVYVQGVLHRRGLVEGQPSESGEAMRVHVLLKPPKAMLISSQLPYVAIGMDFLPPEGKASVQK